MMDVEPPVLLKNKCSVHADVDLDELDLAPPGRNSSETVPVSSLRLAAGQDAEEAVTVGGCPAGFMLAPIVNATVAAAA